MCYGTTKAGESAMHTQRNWMVAVLVLAVFAVAGWGGWTLAPRPGDADAEAGARARTDIALVGEADEPLTIAGPAREAAGAAVSDDANAEQALRLLGQRTDTADPDLPAACLQLSAATDPARAIEDKAFVRVSPAAPFSLQSRGRELCVLGLDADQSYAVTLLPGLKARNGSELRRQATASITFAPKPGMVGFVDDGIILPRTDGAVIGLKAMNAGETEVTLFRVNHRALFQSTPDVGESALDGEWSYNYEAYGTRVEVHRETIDMAGPTNQMIERGVSLAGIVDQQAPGAYIIELARVADEGERRPARSWRWLYVTDIALAAYRGERALHVTARSIETAKTLPDTRVAVIARNNELLAEARTNAEGRAVFPAATISGTGNLAPKMVLAYRGDDDFAALDLARSPLDLSAFDVAGRTGAGPVEAYLYTDRGVYRPGETVRLTALVRDRSGRAALDRPATLTVAKPDGSLLLERRIEPTGMAGAVFRDVAIPTGAPRGRYTATLALDGLDGPAGTLKWAVEDFVPEQLRVALRADGDSVRSGTPSPLIIAADFLYGAAGRGLEAQGEARIQPDPKPFPDFAGYAFGDAVEPFRESVVPLTGGTTDGSGRLRTSLDLGTGDYDTSLPLRARVTAGVAEPSGRVIRDSLLLPIRSKDLYVGLKPVFEGGYARRGQPAEIDIVALDREGERVAADVTLRLYSEDYDYQWFRENDRWRYRRDRRDELVLTQSATVPADRPLRFARALDYGQYRLEVRHESGVSSVQFGSGWRRAGAGSDAPDRFQMGVDAGSYQPGEALTLTLDAPFAGEAELVVADGDVQRIRSLRLREGAQTVRLRTDAASEGDLYVMATLYDPLGDNAAPRRAVGLVHIPRDRASQELELSVKAPETIRPRTRQTVKLALSGAPREPVWLTLAAVDTGILQITDFDPPEPEAFFFGKQAFALDVHDDYARMLAPFNGADRVGGDVLGGAGLSVVPTQTVALWQSPIAATGRTTEVSLDIPDFQGELTLMAVAWSETRIGSASTTMTVRDPVTAQLALPRFLAPGDTAVATVALDNVDGRNGDYTTRVSRGPAQLAERKTRLDHGDRAEETLEVRADGLGVETLTLRTRGPGFDVSRDYSIETRSAALPRTLSVLRPVAPGETRVLELAELGEAFLPASVDTTLSASFSPLMDPAPLLAALQHYPYGCTEQTVSVAAPLLLSERVGTLPGLTDTRRRQRVQSAVDRILARQDASGAVGLWSQGDGHASPYLQLYASEFLLDAHAAGYDMPESAVERTLAAVRSLAQLDGRSRLALDYQFGLDERNPDYERRRAERAAYAHFLLARHSRTAKTQLTYLFERFADDMEDSVALAQLGAALDAMGDAKRAQDAFALAAERLDGRWPRNFYASPTRNAAALIAVGRQLPEDVLSRALEVLPTDGATVLNTHERAWILRAIAGDGLPHTEAPMAGEPGWAQNGSGATREVARDETRLAITNPHERPVWLTLTLRGQPRELGEASANGAALEKSVLAMDGSKLDGSIARGERAIILLEAEAKSPDAAMWVLADLLPAGFEIETVLRPEDAGETGPFGFLGELSPVDMSEARDDRFVASWQTEDTGRYDRTRKRRVAYVVRAVTQGDFAFPGAHLEDMYRAERNATTPGGRLSVTAGGEL